MNVEPNRDTFKSEIYQDIGIHDETITKIRATFEDLSSSIMIEFFRHRETSVPFKRNDWFDLFVISRPQLEAASHGGTLVVSISPQLDSAPFREYGRPGQWYKNLQAVFRAVVPKVSAVLSAQHPRAHAAAEADWTNAAIRKNTTIYIYKDEFLSREVCLLEIGFKLRCKYEMLKLERIRAIRD